MAKKSTRRQKRPATTKATASRPGPGSGSDSLTHGSRAAEPTPDAVAEAMASAAENRGVGRPPGPTDTSPQAVVRPACCPSCRSTDYTVARIIVSRDIAGEIAGQAYDRIIWRRLRCRNCGQLYTARFYEYSGMPTN